MTPASLQQTEHLWAVVDIGSNGIRFSISSLAPPTARIIPTIYQSRTAISLYDAQVSESGVRQPIDDEIITAVVASIRRFKRVCSDYGVPEDQVKVVATEATRTAPNSETLRRRILDASGWDVTLLSKEDEGRIGALGVASSVPEVDGLVMDLGGGSTQLSFMNSSIVSSENAAAVSLPFGAARLIRRLREAEVNVKVPQLEAEIREALVQAYKSLSVPQHVEDEAKRCGGFTLYLSGGGFRGWGYLLMSRHRVHPYPIPCINGFMVTRDEFLAIDSVTAAAASVLKDDNAEIHRISDRRAGQVPAVAFLIRALMSALPLIKDVRFCQGGVREGTISSTMSRSIRTQHPLVVATSPYAPRSADAITKLLLSSLPDEWPGTTEHGIHSIVDVPLIHSFANMLYHHAVFPRDLQASAALRCTTSGSLASAHGLIHESRVLLALLLCARWSGKVPPSDENFKDRMESLVTLPMIRWWINYLGGVAALVAAVHAAGVVAQSGPRLELSSKFSKDTGEPTLLLTLRWEDHEDKCIFAKEIEGIEKVGKRKRWIGGRDGQGYSVNIEHSSR